MEKKGVILLRLHRTILLASVIIMGVIVAGCGAKQNSSKTDQTPLIKAAVVSQLPVTWRSDGLISENEYTSYQKVAEIDIYSRVEGDNVILGLQAKTKGYLAIGIGAEDKMKGADMLLCYVKDGQASVTEMYSTGMFGPHPPKQAANLSVTQVSGTEKDGITTIELKRKLNPGGNDSKPLKIGENKIIWALGDSTDINRKHTARGQGNIILIQ